MNAMVNPRILKTYAHVPKVATKMLKLRKANDKKIMALSSNWLLKTKQQRKSSVIACLYRFKRHSTVFQSHLMRIGCLKVRPRKLLGKVSVANYIMRSCDHAISQNAHRSSESRVDAWLSNEFGVMMYEL